MSVAEQTETLRDERLIAFRRLAQNRVHFALVMPATVYPASVFGASCEAVTAPVAAWCGRTLRGQLVVIPSDYLDGWKKQGHVCRECQLVARLALARTEAE